MSQRKRRSGPAQKEERAPTPIPETSDTEESMSNQQEGSKETAVPTKPRQPVMFALGRCRYKSDGQIVTAEAGDEIKNPDPVDLNDLIEHNCVETFDPDQVQALFSLRDKNQDAKMRLAKAIGIL